MFLLLNNLSSELGCAQKTERWKIKLLETLKTANLGNLGIFHAFYIDGGFKAHSTEPKLMAV